MNQAAPNSVLNFQFVNFFKTIFKIKLSLLSDFICDLFTGDTCSWKGQLERTRSCNVLSWKVSLKSERAKRNWREPSDWKEPIEVGKLGLKLESDL